MVVRCIRRYRDAETKRMVEVGETFEATPEKVKAINGTKYGALVEVEEQVAEEQEAVRQPKRHTTKKEQ